MHGHIAESEGTEFAPYKDTNGKLTVGTGFLVDDEKSFIAMPFEILDPQTGELRPATEAGNGPPPPPASTAWGTR